MRKIGLGRITRILVVLAFILLLHPLAVAPSYGAPAAISKIQVVQSLANQSNKYVAGKNAAILVKLSAPLAVDPNTQFVEIDRGTTVVAQLEPSAASGRVSTLVFPCPTLAACGNWTAGAYTIFAIVGAEQQQISVTFQARKTIKILAVPIKSNYGPGDVRVPTGLWKKMGEYTRSVYPLAANGLQWTLGPMVDASAAKYDLTTEAGQAKMFSEVVKAQPVACRADPIPPTAVGCYDKVVGFVPDRMGADGTLQGFTMGFHTNIVVESDEDAKATVAHEIGHNYDLGDEYNNGSYNCVVNPPFRTFVGNDLLTGDAPYSCPNSRAVLFPGAEANVITAASDVPFEVGGRGLLPNMADFMGSGALQSRNWISGAAWKKIFDGLAPGTAATVNKPVTTKPGAITRWIYAQGYIDRDGTVSVEPWYDFDDEGTQPNTTGAYTLQALNDNDTVLASTNLGIRFNIVDNPHPLTQALFEVVMPFPDGTTTFRFVKGAEILGELPVSDNAPTVQLLNPAPGESVPADFYTVRWTAADADNDQLYYDVEYSTDGGENWEVVDSELEATETEIDFSELAGSTTAQIRVTASDGVNASEDVSAPFTVAPTAPEAYIDGPIDGDVYDAGEQVWLDGVGYDNQDEDITDAAQLAWSSNLQGYLGNGAELSLSNLVPGDHDITLTVTNTLGLTGTDTVTITVDQPFDDVSSRDYFYNAVNWLFLKNAISGYDDLTFKPYNTVTRGQLVKIAVLGLGLQTQPGSTPAFSDVPASNPYYRYVQTAVSRNIVSGYDDAAHCGTNAPCFQPDANVTRAQIAKIVTLAAGWTLVNPATPSFSDVPRDDTFYGVIETAHAHGVISGYGAEYRPGNNAIRAQAAKIVYLAATAPAPSKISK